MPVETKRLTVEVDAYNLAKHGPTIVDRLADDLRREIGNLPFTTPDVLRLRLVAEIDSGTEDEPKPAKAKKKGA